MPTSPTKFIKRCAQWIPKDQSGLIPRRTRGVYALLQERPKDRFDVMYIGMTSRSSIGKRLGRHKTKLKGWTHFSMFEIWDNIGEQELKELEGLLREIYRKDTQANRLNKQRKYQRLQKVRENDLSKWKGEAE
jgi:hypothetical protein